MYYYSFISCQYYKKLQGWNDRENDGLYKTLSIDCRPLSPRVGIKDVLKIMNTELNDIGMMMMTMTMSKSMSMNGRSKNENSYKQIKINSIQNLIEMINKYKIMYEKK